MATAWKKGLTKHLSSTGKSTFVHVCTTRANNQQNKMTNII